jgi:hypothetical protein
MKSKSTSASKLKTLTDLEVEQYMMSSSFATLNPGFTIRHIYPHTNDITVKDVPNRREVDIGCPDGEFYGTYRVKDTTRRFPSCVCNKPVSEW